MRRLAAGDPFTNRPFRFVVVRFRVVARRVVVFFRVVRFLVVRFFERRVRDGDSNACTACDCCAKPANPPGGTNGLAVGISLPQCSLLQLNPRPPFPFIRGNARIRFACAVGLRFARVAHCLARV